MIPLVPMVACSRLRHGQRREYLRRPKAPVRREYRLAPSDAMMHSQTWEPLFGLSSSTDATGRVTYYEYDKLGRQTLVRDQERNILSKTEYMVQGPQ